MVRSQKKSATGIPDMRDRVTRRARARILSRATGVDVDLAEQVLLMRTLPPWERLARGLRRSRLGKAEARSC